ncbi:MAG TPA: TldD/PmbA family protein [Solirubrobacteraceae bacterium]|nr:TldD/PmbA family protein [Solirubrobacteraceae bacterium]
MTPLDDLVELMAAAHGRCSYAEARRVHRVEQRAGVRNGRVDAASHDESDGIGVRVRVGGAWGFAATRDTTRAGAERALARAIAIAQALPPAAERPRSEEEPARGHWSHPVERDPTGVPLDERLELLLAVDEAMRCDPRVVRTDAGASATRVVQAFASTDGAACTQEQVACGAGIAAVAVGDGEMQVRTYPTAHGGHVALAGWEHVLGLDLPGNAPRVAAEAAELLTAPPCPAGRATIVLHPEQLALQVHESVGHALELDRILLGEAAYAGTSWVRPEDLGALRYGSELMTITADATLPGGLGTFGWDDEGTAARRTTLVEGGVLRAALSDREAAAAVGAESAGCARAAGFDRQPIVRMTNVSLEPGEAGSFADLLADTGDGLFLETNRSWSIDDRRLHFQFATEVAREITGGELGRLLRNPTYAGTTPSFWASLDAVCSPEAWELWGVTDCGKGEPGQFLAVSHGAAPARFRDVEVGVA